MGLWLEAAGKLAVVERTPGRTSKVWPSSEQVIGHLRLGAFASPGSPPGLPCVFVLPRIKNSAGYIALISSPSAIFRLDFRLSTGS